MVTRDTYGDDAVRACEAVLIEVTHLLGEFRDHVVLVGGWVPGLLFAQADEQHAGSLDIDLAFDLRSIPPKTYQTILQALAARGYEQDPQQPFRFFRTVALDGGTAISVEVDLLAGEYGGTGKSRRTQKIQDVQARKARGVDLVFESPVPVQVTGQIPGGARDQVTVRVAAIVPFLVMKGMALADRIKEKDAYDIVYCLRNYPGGLSALAEECRPHLGNGLVREGLGKIRSKFASVDQVGPRWVADFEALTDPDERAILQRRSYEEVNQWLDMLAIGPWEG